MHQSVVEYDVAPSTMTMICPAGDSVNRIQPAMPGTRRSATKAPLLRKVSRDVAGSLASYLVVAGMAVSLVAAWAALCAI